MATASYAGTNYALMAAPRVGTWPNAAGCRGELYCMAGDCVASGAALDADSLMYMGILPVGAVVQFSIVWPITTATFGEQDGMTLQVTGTLGTVADPDLFGDILRLDNTTLPQVIEPCPDVTIYTTTLDFALRTETTVVFTALTSALTAAEGVAVKVLYTMAGRTY